jgi:hypothetical protein
MLTQLTNSDKLATLPELRYLLMEVLDRPEPISWYDLSFSCKELSFNFAFTFDSTMIFLETLSIIKVGKGKIVTRAEGDYSGLKSEEALSVFIMGKALTYLAENKILDQVVNKETFISDLPNNSFAIDVNKMPVNALFMRVLMLNLGMAVPDKNENGRLIISPTYRDYFRNEFSGIVSELIDKNKQTTDTPEPNRPKKPTLFISYAHEDEEYKDELQKHLSGLVIQGVIQSWNGRAILGGEDWDDAVKKKLELAEIVLFLVSSDFMASRYINNVEIKKTMERHNSNLVKIIPIIVRPCDFRALPIGKYQALPTGAKAISEWKNKDVAYLQVVNGIRKVLSMEHE